MLEFVLFIMMNTFCKDLHISCKDNTSEQQFLSFPDVQLGDLQRSAHFFKFCFLSHS